VKKYLSEVACPRFAADVKKHLLKTACPRFAADVKKHLSETACPRYAAEAVPPKFFHFENEWKGSKKGDSFKGFSLRKCVR